MQCSLYKALGLDPFTSYIQASEWFSHLLLETSKKIYALIHSKVLSTCGPHNLCLLKLLDTAVFLLYLTTSLSELLVLTALLSRGRLT